MTFRVSHRNLEVGYAALLSACIVCTVGWLGIGAVVGAASYSAGFAAALRTAAGHGTRWAAGILAAAPHSEPLGEAVADYALSALNLVLAGFLLFQVKRTWVAQLLAVAMIASAAAFNLQAHASRAAVMATTGVDIGGLHQVLLHGVGCAAFVVALLLLPSGRWDAKDRSTARAVALVGTGVGTLLVVGFGTALLPHTISCILFFGFTAPLIGLIALPPRNGDAGAVGTAEQRSQTRLMFSVLLAAFGTSVILGVITGALWYLGQPGLVLVDPTARGTMGTQVPGQPTALLFWFSRLSSAGIALGVLVAIRRSRLWAAERLLSRGLASAMVIVLIGGGYVVVRAVVVWLPGAEDAQAALVATALAALALLPAYRRAQRLVDRLLYGQRPTPYSVLAEVTALARANSGDGPNFARAAEAIGRGLGARFCRLTVLRPGLRERDYLWTDGPASEQLDPDDLVALPISQGNEQIGSIAVDRGAVAGLRSERRTLLQDVADSLGAIVAASRTGIELERQLRAVVANAEEIAVSRRQAVAEMDSERRTIERDLHDGAQHHLVTLRLSLGLVEHEVASGQLEQARDRLGQLAGQLDTVGEVLAKTASGVSSIVLSEQGVVQALTAELTSASGGQPGVELVVEDVARRCRLAASAEAAVYFCCLESVNNARKHAEGAPIAVHIGLANGELWFRVRDEGPGFDPAAVTGSGRGQRNLAARMQAVGGVVAIESEPGAGTTVRGTVPLPPEARTEPSVPPARPSGAPVPAGSAASVVALATTPLSQASQQPGPPPTRPPARRPGPPPARQPSQLPPRRPPMPGGPGSLFARAHELLAAARQVYRGGPGRARLEQLAGRMTEPLRVVLAGDPGAGTSTLCRALASLPPSTALPPYLRLIDGGPPSAAGGGPLSAAGGGPLSAAGPPPDVLVLVLRGPGDDDPRLFGAQPAGLAVGLAPVVGVLARADQLAESAAVAIKRAGQVAEAYLAEPEVRHACQGMLVASGLLGLLGGTVTQQEYQYLVAIAEHPDQPPAPSDAGSSDRAPLERFGVVGMRVAVELIKDGSAPNRDRLAAELVSRSGLLELRGLLTGRFAEVAGALRVRSALAELEALVHASPPALPGLERFSYQLERFRSGAHELVELELVEAIRSGRVRLAGGDRHAAEQLLGMAGDSPAARLGLAIDADPAAIQLAAAHQLAQWQRIASHPVTTGAVREAADFLIRTCEELLARR